MTKQTSPSNLSFSSSDMPWTPAALGLDHQLLTGAACLAGDSTAFYRLAPGASLGPLPPEQGVELIVLEGDLQFPGGGLGVGGYLRQPEAWPQPPHSNAGCKLFMKLGRFAAGDQDPVRLESKQLPWLSGHGNLEVKPLSSFEGHGTALVRWPAGERFVMHQHWGGEEILVLSGTFEDEHGRYPKGTWIQSPHLSRHHPFVREETVIFVKTGHLPIPAR